MKLLVILMTCVAVALAQPPQNLEEAREIAENMRSKPFQAMAIGMAARLDSQEVRLNELTAGVQKLVERVTTGTGMKDKVTARLKAFDSILNFKFGNGCSNKKWIPCGGDTTTCVTAAVMCDGVQDCPNGGDEVNCGNPMEAGSVWRGVKIYDNCTNRKPSSMTLTIGEYTGKNMKTSLAVTGENWAETKSALLFSDAWFSTARQAFVMRPPESDGLGVVCIFNLGRSDRCMGFVIRAASGERCASFLFDKQ